MQPQLQHGIDAAAGFLLELLQAVEVPRIDHQRLLAEGVGADAQRQPHVRIVQVVWRADAEIVDALGFGAALEFFEMPIEALELGEESDVEGVAIEHADRVMRIDGRHQAVAGVVDRFQVPRGDETRRRRSSRSFCGVMAEGCNAARSTPAS